MLTTAEQYRSKVFDFSREVWGKYENIIIFSYTGHCTYEVLADNASTVGEFIGKRPTVAKIGVGEHRLMLTITEGELTALTEKLVAAGYDVAHLIPTYHNNIKQLGFMDSYEAEIFSRYL